jgi:hypothetical protein
LSVIGCGKRGCSVASKTPIHRATGEMVDGRGWNQDQGDA